ncbi:MAG: stage V sporulation protein AE [Christensenellales bacterium]|jgi:stage V sporulation protein AE
MEFVKAFLVGGFICMIGQILLLKTNLTAPKILVTFVTAGVILTALGLYEPLVEFAQAGATIPLTGFGYALAKGAIEAAQEDGLMGALMGGTVAASAGIAAAVLFGYLNAVIFSPKTKD